MQKALQEAQEDLAATQSILENAKKQLTAVEDGIASLQTKYQDCLAKKDELDKKFQLCEARLIRADKVRIRENIALQSNVCVKQKCVHCFLFIT